MNPKYCNPYSRTHSILGSGVDKSFIPAESPTKYTVVLPTQGMGKNHLQISNMKTVYSFQVFCHSEFIFRTGLKFLQKEINECIASVSQSVLFLLQNCITQADHLFSTDLTMNYFLLWPKIHFTLKR